MPKTNPKHQAQLERITEDKKRKSKRIYNWKKIGGGITVAALVTAFIVLLAVFYQTPSLSADQIQPGDRVYIYFTLTAANGTTIDQSATSSGTYFVISKGSGGQIPCLGFYDNVIGLRVGDVKSFTIPACPTHDCTAGYTTGGLAWQELNFYVIIKEILPRTTT